MQAIKKVATFSDITQYISSGCK